MRQRLPAILLATLLGVGAGALVTDAAADHIPRGYVKPDPVPRFMRQPCQTNSDGVPYWNCFYDKRTMYDPGDATHSYYQVRAKTQDGKSKYVCFLYWKQSWARKQNVCIEW
jgi:hypothetical protein